MKKHKIYLAYLKEKRLHIFLFILFLVVMFLIYSLYSTAFAPAFYTAILMVFIGSLFLAIDCHLYVKKTYELLSFAKNFGKNIAFLGDDTLQGKIYLDMVNNLNEQASLATARATEKEKDAQHYYTLWSHQIKTPLSAMKLLLTEKDPDLKQLGQEVFKAEQYVNMALQYQRLATTTKDLSPTNVCVYDIINESAKRLSTLFIAKNLSIEICPMKLNVVTDAKWLAFVVEQILTNAAKYTKVGGVTIYTQSENSNILIIQDSGIGILPQDLPRIFGWGYTGFNGRQEARSTGLGLFLCDNVCKMLGFSLSIDSEVGKGTQVKIDMSQTSLETD